MINGHIISFDLFDRKLYLNSKNGDISFHIADVMNQYEIDYNEFLLNFRPRVFNFCLNISNACNLACDYCFNKSKNGKLMRSEDAIKALKLFFDAFPNGDKYFIDLSGKGEPLLNKKRINDVSKFAVDESNKLRREVTIQLVTNGTLLNEENVKFLQERNILFGVSLDGNKLIHDLHRKTALGQPTFEIIINNVKKIKNKDYVGCACTLTNDVFDLTAAIIELSNYFKTLSFRLCRGELYSLNQESALKWQKEYETLSRFLIKEIELGNSKIFKCLINGDDMFGRYLYRMFGNTRTLNRCDGLISRLTYDINGEFYGCPASNGIESFSFNLENLEKTQQDEIERQVNTCKVCPFKFYCGGECKLELIRNGEISKINCYLKKELIKLAAYLKNYCLENNLTLFKELNEFCNEKRSRGRLDKNLLNLCEKYPNMEFTKIKKMYDSMNHKY